MDREAERKLGGGVEGLETVFERFFLFGGCTDSFPQFSWKRQDTQNGGVVGALSSCIYNSRRKLEAELLEQERQHLDRVLSWEGYEIIEAQKIGDHAIFKIRKRMPKT